MKNLKIKFPHLKHISFTERYQAIEVPEELLKLIGELIPSYMSVLTNHKKDTVEAIESEQLMIYNRDLKSKILAFDIETELVFIVNNIPMIVKIYEDKDLNRKALDIYQTKIVTLNYQWCE